MPTQKPVHGLHRANVKYAVFAGNFREFYLWQEHYQVRGSEALFIAERGNLAALQATLSEGVDPPTYIIVGTFHLRGDFQELMELARDLRPEATFYRAEFPQTTKPTS